MSFTHFKEPEPPCITIGCGDNSSRQIGAEKRALLYNKYVKIQTSSSCRRIGYSRTQKTESQLTIPGGEKLKKCKKAASLEDLTKTREEEVKGRRRRAIRMPSSNVRIAANKLSTQDDNRKNNTTSLAARRLCQVLVLNAWRRRRRDAVQLTFTIQELGTQVENLNIQTIVLRRLLDSEKTRVAHANADVQQIMSQVEESRRERDALKTEKEDLEKEIMRLEDCMTEMQTKCQNLKNDFLAARAEVSILETQMGKERDKLAKLREDKKHLLDKVQTTEELVVEKNYTIDRMQASCKELENQLTAQEEKCVVMEADSLSAKKSVKLLEQQQSHLTVELQEVGDLSQQLKAQISNLNGLLRSKDNENGELQKKIQEQRMEIRDLEMRLLEQAQMQNSWRSRALQIAVTFARVPLSIFHNVAFMFSPQNQR